MSADRVEKFTSGQAIGVDVNAIERDLAALWRQAAESAASAGGKAVTRACSWNLIVHAPSEAEHQRAKSLVDAIVASVPSRTIVVRPMPNAVGAEIEAFVTANCQVAPGGGKLLCSEEITIEARGRGLDHVPSLLRALLVPDIPTAALFCGVPPSDPAVIRMVVGGVDRIVVDTAHASQGGLGKLAHVGGLVDGVQLADLNWLRLASLRYVLAGVFDPPFGPDPLFRLKKVRIEAVPSGLPAAHLLVGWLASRLSWGAPERHVDAEAPSWSIPRHQGKVKVSIDVVEQSDRRSGVRAIHLESDQGEKVSVCEKNGALEVQGTDVPSRTVAADEHKDAELLVAALGARGRDKLYAVALHRAVELER